MNVLRYDPPTSANIFQAYPKRREAFIVSLPEAEEYFRASTRLVPECYLGRGYG